MVEPGLMRASDTERDEVLEQLRRAHVEGRLDYEEPPTALGRRWPSGPSERSPR